MKGSVKENLLPLLLDKLIFALIVGVALVIASLLADSKIEKLKNDLEIQRVYYEHQVKYNQQLWKAIYKFSYDFHFALTKNRQEDLKNLQESITEVFETIASGGYFLGGHDKVQDLKSRIYPQSSENEINENLKKAYAGDEEAEKWLWVYSENYINTQIRPTLKEIENLHLQ